MEDAANLTELFEQLLRQYDLQGLKELSTRIGVDYEDLEANSRRGLALSIVRYMQRRNRLPELAALMKADAPASPVQQAQPRSPVPTTSGVKPMALSGEQYQSLTDALEAAFPNEDVLRRMVRFKLNLNLDAIARGGTLIDRIYYLIEAAEAGGWTGKLIVGARQFNPGNPKLEAFAVAYGLGSVGPNEKGIAEVMLREELPFQDFRAWLGNLGQQEPRVCRVEIPMKGKAATVCREGLACGTGFLVDKDLLLTAFHVVEPLMDWQKRQAAGQKWANPEDVRLRFDYVRREGEEAIHQGTVFKLSADWDVLHRLGSQADFKASALPTNDELDFALLRVANTPGDQPVGGVGGLGAAKRGWIALPDEPAWPKKDGTIFILQHPEGEPLKLAPPDRILDLNDNRTRVRYLVNTKQGSSGSPCFDAMLRLVALHHFGIYETYNQGVPIATITPLIRPHLSY